MADDPTAHAIDVMARAIAARAVTIACDGLGDIWEEYPAISEHDIERITVRLDAESALLRPCHDQIDAAYEHLASRAGGLEALDGGEG